MALVAFWLIFCCAIYALAYRRKRLAQNAAGCNEAPPAQYNVQKSTAAGQAQLVVLPCGAYQVCAYTRAGGLHIVYAMCREPYGPVHQQPAWSLARARRQSRVDRSRMQNGSAGRSGPSEEQQPDH